MMEVKKIILTVNCSPFIGKSKLFSRATYFEKKSATIVEANTSHRITARGMNDRIFQMYLRLISDPLKSPFLINLQILHDKRNGRRRNLCLHDDILIDRIVYMIFSLGITS